MDSINFIVGTIGAIITGIMLLSVFYIIFESEKKLKEQK
jgi:hypothetical protein